MSDSWLDKLRNVITSTEQEQSEGVSPSAHYLSATESALETAQAHIEEGSLGDAKAALEKARNSLEKITDDPADPPPDLAERYTAASQQLTTIAEKLDTASQTETETETETEIETETETTADSPRCADLLQELHRLTTALGRVPLAPEMRERGSYNPHQYYDEFGGWDEALLAAGIDKEAALIRDIQRVAQHVEDTPTTTDMQKHGRYSSGVHTMYFDSWDDALSAAGIPEETGSNATSPHTEAPDEKPDLTENTDESAAPTEQEYIDELTRLQQESKLYVRPQDMNTDGAYSANELIETFGSWNEALAAADIDKGEILATEMQRLASKLGHPPTQSEMQSHGRCSPSPYTKYFGSWSAAKEQCLSNTEWEPGPSEDENKTTNEPSREAIIEEIQQLNEEVEGVFKAGVLRQQGSVSLRETRDEFGSWENALDAAGIDRKKQIIDEIRRVADEVGERPSRPIFDTQAQISSTTVTKYFESFAVALDVALEDTTLSGQESNETTPEHASSVQSTGATTIGDLTTEGRLEEPLLLRIEATDESPGPRKQAELQVQDVEGKIIPFQIWEVHDVQVDWISGHWYEIEGARLKLWLTDRGETMKRLSSTNDLTVTHLNEGCELRGGEPQDKRRPEVDGQDQSAQPSHAASGTSTTPTDPATASNGQCNAGDNSETSDDLQDEIDDLLAELDI